MSPSESRALEGGWKNLRDASLAVAVVAWRAAAAATTTSTAAAAERSVGFCRAVNAQSRVFLKRRLELHTSQAIRMPVLAQSIFGIAVAGAVAETCFAKKKPVMLAFVELVRHILAPIPRGFPPTCQWDLVDGKNRLHTPIKARATVLPRAACTSRSAHVFSPAITLAPACDRLVNRLCRRLRLAVRILVRVVPCCVCRERQRRAPTRNTRPRGREEEGGGGILRVAQQREKAVRPYREPRICSAIKK